MDLTAGFRLYILYALFLLSVITLDLFLACAFDVNCVQVVYECVIRKLGIELVGFKLMTLRLITLKAELQEF